MGIIPLVLKGFGIAAKSRVLFALLFVFSFIWALINLPFSKPPAPENVAESFTVLAISFVFILTSVYMNAGTLGYVKDILKSGTSTLAAFKDYAKRFYLRILAVSGIVALFVIILTVLAALAMLLGGETPNIFSVVFALVVVVIGFFGVLGVFFAPYILIADNTRAIASLKFSIDFVKKNFLQVLLLGLVFILVGVGITAILQIVIGLLAKVLPEIGTKVLLALLGSVLNAFMAIWVSSSFLSCYLDTKHQPSLEQPLA